MSRKIIIQQRILREVNTDPQRRCYNGAHFSSEMQWSSWGDLELVAADKVKSRLTFWRELNAYSVSVGGKPREFRTASKDKQWE